MVNKIIITFLGVLMLGLNITMVHALSIGGDVEVSASADVSFSEVHDWMFSNGLTTMSEANFRGESNVSRGEISKFFANYALMKGMTKVKTSAECQFKDLDGYDATLVPTIIAACEYGLVKGSNGNYYPHNDLTEAEALTVIVRTMVGFQDEAQTPRRNDYYRAGRFFGIININSYENRDRNVLTVNESLATRATVGARIYNANVAGADEYMTDNRESIEEDYGYITEVNVVGDNSYVKVNLIAENDCMSIYNTRYGCERPKLSTTLTLEIDDHTRYLLTENNLGGMTNRTYLDFNAFNEWANTTATESQTNWDLRHEWETSLTEETSGDTYEGPSIYMGSYDEIILKIWHDGEKAYLFEDLSYAG